MHRGGLRWFGHVERMEGDTCVGRYVNVDGGRPLGPPGKTWDKVLRNNLQVKGLIRETARDCSLESCHSVTTAYTYKNGKSC